MQKRNFTILAIAFLVSSAATTRAGRFTAPYLAPGNVEGTITYTGTPPKMKPIDMAKEPTCAKQHATPVMTEAVVTGPGNTLEYAVVYGISANARFTFTPWLRRMPYAAA